MGRATICAGSRWCVGRNPLYAAVLGVLLSAVAFGQTARDFVLDGRDAWRSAKQNARLSGRLGGERMVGRRVARCVSVGSPVWSFSRDRSYRIAPTVVNVGAFGGRRVVNVTVEAGCAWTAVSNVPWVTIASGASGSRSGIDGDVVAFNRGGMWEGMAASAGRTFKVVQPGVGGGARPENLDSTFGAGQVGTGYVIHAVAVQPDGKVVIGGQFNLVNGVARNCIARLNADGTLDMGFGAGTANDDFPFVLAVAVQPDGKVVIGGGFTRVNGVARGGIARLNVDGTLDASFGARQSGASDWVEAMAVQPDGKVVIGGRFTRVNGVARGGIARLNADGTLDTSFGAGQGGVSGGNFPRVHAVAVQPDGKVVIGGKFTRVNGVARNCIARLNADGTLDASFGAGQSGVNGLVEAVVVQPDGKVVLGGWFTRVNGVARSGIARLNADGTLDTSFGAGQSGVSGGRFPAVSAVAVQPDGKVVLGGKFTRVNGVARSGIARLNVDGTLDASFGAGQSGVSESVDAVVVQSDGKVVLGGRFTRVNGVARGGIARLNADGTLDASFGAGQSGVSESVDAVVVKPDVRLAALKKRLSGRLNVMALWQVCQR